MTDQQCRALEEGDYAIYWNYGENPPACRVVKVFGTRVAILTPFGRRIVVAESLALPNSTDELLRLISFAEYCDRRPNECV